MNSPEPDEQPTRKQVREIEAETDKMVEKLFDELENNGDLTDEEREKVQKKIEALTSEFQQDSMNKMMWKDGKLVPVKQE